MTDEQQQAEVLRHDNGPTGITTTFTAGDPKPIPLVDHAQHTGGSEEQDATGREIAAAAINRAKILVNQVTSRIRGAAPQTGK